MYSRFRLLIVFCGFALIFQSCVFQSPDENFKVIDPTPKVELTIQYSSGGNIVYDAIDTLWIEDRIYINTTGRMIKQCQLVIDGHEVLIDNTYPGNFTLERGTLAAGYHETIITYTVAANTNSLSDQLGTESATVSYPFVLAVLDNNYNPEITNVAVKDGAIKIDFKPYVGKNFKSYTLRKTRSDQTTYYKTYTVSSRDQASIIDSTFVGGSVDYQLVVNIGPEKISEPYHFQYYYLPNVEILPVDKTHLKLSWPQTKLYANIGTYDVTYGGNTYSGLTNNNREILIDNNVPFEVMRDVSIKQNSRSDGEGFTENAFSYKDAVFVGKHLPAYYHVIHDPVEPVYYSFQTSTSNSEMLYKINDVTFEVIDSIAIPASIYSTEAQIVISPNGLYHHVIVDNQIIGFSTAPLQITYTKLISALPLNGESSSWVYNENSFASVDNNNHLMFRGQQTSKIYIVDMSSFDKVFEIILFPSLTDTGHLSADGAYLVMQQYIYKWTGTTFAFDKQLTYSEILYEQFIYNNPNKLLIVSKTAIIVYDCEAHAEISNTPVSTIAYANLDQVTQKVCFQNNSTVANIFDLNTLTLSQISAYWNSVMTLQGGTLLFSNNVNPQYGAFALPIY